MAPSFKSQDEMEELLTWLYETTTDPVSDKLYPEALGRGLWIGFRFDVNYTS